LSDPHVGYREREKAIDNTICQDIKVINNKQDSYCIDIVTCEDCHGLVYSSSGIPRSIK
jgi:hypothetical protein